MTSNTATGPEGAPTRAIDAPGVRPALRRRRAARLAVLAISLVVVAGAATALARHERRTDPLRRTGVEVTGRVVAVGGGRVSVSYERNGRSRTFSAELGPSAPAYRVGQRILVLVDPTDPSGHLVKGEQGPTDWIPVLLGLGVGLGAVGALLGTVGLRRGRHEARVLRAGPWRRVGMRTARRSAPPGLGRHVVLINEAGREHVLGITSTGIDRRTIRRLHGRDRAEVVGDLTDRVVLRDEGGDGFITARVPPNSTVDRRWRLALGAPPRR